MYVLNIYLAKDFYLDSFHTVHKEIMNEKRILYLKTLLNIYCTWCKKELCSGGFYFCFYFGS